jgi:hypothetical protein
MDFARERWNGDGRGREREGKGKGLVLAAGAGARLFAECCFQIAEYKAPLGPIDRGFTTPTLAAITSSLAPASAASKICARLSLRAACLPPLRSAVSSAGRPIFFQLPAMRSSAPQADTSLRACVWLVYRRANVRSGKLRNTQHEQMSSVVPLPAQPVDARQALNLSAGVSNCKVSRGRSFS